MIGRTHGVHAEPMTFGVKLALWFAEIERDTSACVRARTAISVGKLSGAVGMFAHLSIRRSKRAVCQHARPRGGARRVAGDSARPSRGAAVARWRLLAASLEKFALEIRGLQKTEIGEVEEPFAEGQKGSSAMPHKRNPIGCEQIVGLARLIRANANAAFENVALWHERDISHSSVERVILPDSFIALDHMLRRFTRIVAGMVVYPERMRENLDRSRGVVFSGTVLLELAQQGRLARAGVRMGAAQRDAVVRRAARLQGVAARRRGHDDGAVARSRRSSTRSTIETQLQHVDEAFDRGFQQTESFGSAAGALA